MGYLIPLITLIYAVWLLNRYKYVVMYRRVVLHSWKLFVRDADTGSFGIDWSIYDTLGTHKWRLIYIPMSLSVHHRLNQSQYNTLQPYIQQSIHHTHATYYSHLDDTVLDFITTK